MADLTPQQHALLGVAFTLAADQLAMEDFLTHYYPVLDGVQVAVAVSELRTLADAHHRAAGAPMSEDGN